MNPHPEWSGGPTNYWLALGQWDVAVYERQGKWKVRFSRITLKQAYATREEAQLAGEALARRALLGALEALDGHFVKEVLDEQRQAG